MLHCDTDQKERAGGNKAHSSTVLVMMDLTVSHIVVIKSSAQKSYIVTQKMHTAFIYDICQCYGSDMHCKLTILCICAYHGSLHGNISQTVRHLS